MPQSPLVEKLNALLRGGNGSSFGDLVKSLESFINEDNIRRKTRTSIDEVNILVEINAVNRYLKEHNLQYDDNGAVIKTKDSNGHEEIIGLENSILKGMAEDITDYLISLDGASRLEMIEMFQNVKQEIARQQEANK